MKKITVNGKEYKIKFGYLAVSNSNILGEVLKTQAKLEEMENKDVDSETSAALISEIIPLVGKVTLAGMQRYHADEFGVDYEDENDVKQKSVAVYRLLDEYFDPEEGEAPESAIEMFWAYVVELSDAGFLSVKAGSNEKNEPKQPQDHKKPEK